MILSLLWQPMLRVLANSTFNPPPTPTQNNVEFYKDVLSRAEMEENLMEKILRLKYHPPLQLTNFLFD
jgi:hypothetical protein